MGVNLTLFTTKNNCFLTKIENFHVGNTLRILGVDLIQHLGVNLLTRFCKLDHFIMNLNNICLAVMN